MYKNTYHWSAKLLTYITQILYTSSSLS